MTVSNFPYGISTPFIIGGGSPIITTGKRVFAHSGTGVDSGNNSGEVPKKPLASIEAALDKCVNNAGDIVDLMPGHAETLSSAGAITLDKAGVLVRSVGRGGDRATLTFDNTAADINFDAASVQFDDIVFVNDVDGLIAPIDINAANIVLNRCEFLDSTAAKQTLDWIVADVNATWLKLLNCKHIGSDTAGAQSFVNLAAATSRVEIINLISNGDLAVGNIEIAAAVVDILIANCYLENANAVDVNISVGNVAATGWLAQNKCRIATDAQTTWISQGAASELSLFENYGVNNDAETGVLIGTASA